MPVEAEQFGFEEAKQKLDIEQKDLAVIEINRAFINGDHWQKGLGWIGPQPDPADANAHEIFARLQIAFTSKNLMLEVCRRVKGAVIGQEPDWSFVPKVRGAKVEEVKSNPLTGEKVKTGRMVDAPLPDGDQKLVDEAEAIALNWWDQRGALLLLQQFVMNRLSLGRGLLRYFIPPGKLTDAGSGVMSLPKMKDAQEAAMKLIFAETPKPEDCAVIMDTEQMEEYAVTSYTRRPDTTDEQEVIELVFVQDDGTTIIETLIAETTAPGEGVVVDAAQTTPTTAKSSPLALDGKLTVYESKGDPLISEPLRQNQKLINLALTMMAHNIVEAGFSERTYINADLPGTEVDDESSPTGKRLIPDSMPRGAGVMTNLIGVQQRDSSGNMTVATPQVIDREPAPVTTFTDSTEEATWNILEECQQLHALISGDASPSGESRIQALADFAMSCIPIKTAVEKAGRHMLEVLVALAAQLAGQPKHFETLRANFSVKIYMGKLGADERSALLDEMEKRVRSRRNVMVALGVEDPDAEMVAIDEDEATQKQLNPPMPPPVDPNAPKQPGQPNPIKPGAPGPIQKQPGQ